MTDLPDQFDASRLSRADQERLVAIMQEREHRMHSTVMERMFPDEGPLRRALYPKHLEFFRAGKRYRERCAMAANRVGKTFGMGGYESACHLTGLYPPWWEGRRFDTPVEWWAAGTTSETTRDVVQQTLLGKVKEGERKGVTGYGVIPGRLIGEMTWKQGVQNLADTVKIKHVTGAWSELGLKSYHQGSKSFEGTAKHGIWLDEEPPPDVYNECLIRTATTDGLIMITFTPLGGMSEVVIQFLPAEQRPEVAS